MKTKKTIILIAIMLLVVLNIVIGIIYNNTKKVGNNPITINLENISNTGLTMVLKNHTTNKYLYGDIYEIDRKEDNNWIPVHTIETCAFAPIGRELKPKKKVSEEINWEACKGKLPPGQYRITKDFRSTAFNSNQKEREERIVSVEFTI